MDAASLLARCAPEDVGISSGAVERFLTDLAAQNIEAHSLMLMRRGRVAAEGWWAPYGPQLPHKLFSLSKSFTATAAGLCIAEGRFSLDDPVLAHFAEDAPRKPSEHLKAMRVRDLLCMATGHQQEPWEHIPSGRGWVKGFLAADVPHQPGTFFLYNSLATFMVSALVQKTTGEKLVDYLTPRLFAPLGMETPTWEETAEGICCGGWGLNLRTEDIARFGQMLLQEGRWMGAQLVPRHWVALMTSWQVDNSRDRALDWAQGYGFQFWRCQGEGIYRGDGMFGQFCIVMPRQEAVLAMTCATGNMQGVMNAVYAQLLPGFHDALPPDPAAALALKDRLAALALPLLTSDPGAVIAPQLLGRAWRAEVPWQGRHELLEICLQDKGERLSFAVRFLRMHRGSAGYNRPLPWRCTFLDAAPGVPGGQPSMAQAAVRADGSVELHITVTTAPMRVELSLTPKGSGAQVRLAVAPGSTLASTAPVDAAAV